MNKRVIMFKEVVDGKWSSAGNFLGKCLDGLTVHIYEKQMEQIGFQFFETNQDVYTCQVKFPIYVLAYNKEFINQSNLQVVRLTALSVWKSYKDLIEALLDQQNIDTEIDMEVQKSMKKPD